MRTRLVTVIVAACAGVGLLVACADEGDNGAATSNNEQVSGGGNPDTTIDNAGGNTNNAPTNTSSGTPSQSSSGAVISSDPFGTPPPEDPPPTTKDAGSTDSGVKMDAAAPKPDSGTSSSSSSSSSGTSGTSSSSSSSSSGGAGMCSVTRSGGTNDAPDGIIPVCCAPTAAQKTSLDELFTLLNQYRAQQGKAALTYDTKLEAAVQGHCMHMVKHNFFDHFAPEAVVKGPGERSALCGTTASAENLAGGQSTPTQVMNDWKNSAGHNANMIGNYKRVGLCRSGNFWGQIFGN